LVEEVAPVEVERVVAAEAVVEREVDAVVVAEDRALAGGVVDAVQPALAHVVTQIDAKLRAVVGEADIVDVGEDAGGLAGTGRRRGADVRVGGAGEEVLEHAGQETKRLLVTELEALGAGG